MRSVTSPLLSPDRPRLRTPYQPAPHALNAARSAARARPAATPASKQVTIVTRDEAAPAVLKKFAAASAVIEVGSQHQPEAKSATAERASLVALQRADAEVEGLILSVRWSRKECHAWACTQKAAKAGMRTRDHGCLVSGIHIKGQNVMSSFSPYTIVNLVRILPRCARCQVSRRSRVCGTGLVAAALEAKPTRLTAEQGRQARPHGGGQASPASVRGQA